MRDAHFRRNPAVSGRKRAAARGVLSVLLILMAAYLFSRLQYQWNWRVVLNYRELFYLGFVNTVTVSAGAISLGLAIGVAAGLGRLSSNVFVSELCAMYVEIFRGTPLLTQIYIFYFCLAAVIHYDNPFIIGMIALGFFSGAYVAEMVRAGVESIDAGQWDAALGTGFSNAKALRCVIFPQAFRRIIPPVAGQFVSLIKDSSLLSVISVRELTKAAEMVNATTYKTFEAYLPLAAFYFLLTWPTSRLAAHLEKVFRDGGRKA